MKNSVRDIFGKLYLKAATFNNPFYLYGLPKAAYEQRGSKIYLKTLGVTVDHQLGECLIRGYAYAKKVVDSLGAKITIEDNAVMLYLNDLRLRINSAEEFFIINEVFVETDYNYKCINDTVVIDVGMNSGITTLYYALQANVKKVYSYELFEPTYLLATKNLEINAKYASKVEAFNVGLSDRSYETTVDYSLSKKGRMGLKGIPVDEELSDIVKETVRVRDIADVVNEIVSSSGSMDIIVKMDCEGEEYNLIRRLSETRLLEKLNVLMIEWHYKTPHEMQSQLMQAGFHVFTGTQPSLDCGMIYAANGRTPK